MSVSPLRLVGAPGSPYSRKMHAVLRYRRIPFRWIVRGGPDDVGTPDVPVQLIPVLVTPGEDGAADTSMIDSTPIIRYLEKRESERSVIPSDPAVAFLDALIEDYGDEWLTKAMFHYRWAYQADIDKAGKILPLWRDIRGAGEGLAKLSKMFCERQIGRLGVVGSNPTTGPLIEDSYRRFLRALDARLQEARFVMGDRPGSADFGVYGQLTQLALFDPTCAAVTLEESPRVFAWCQLMEDLSGLEPSEDDWVKRDSVPSGLRSILQEVGRVYAPFLLGNAAALERGDAQVECEIDGHKWVQKPFPYQGKCLVALRKGYAALKDADRAAVDAALSGTGCESLFS
jgi:glutathione S-transferase